MSETVREITDVQLDEQVLKSDVPVVLDMWAPWCGPCKTLGPVVEEVSSLYAGKCKILKINIDDNPETPTKFGVMSIPTLVFFKNGEEVARTVGVISKEELIQKIDEML